MTSVGSFEAKTHLPQLLERVACGEKIVITRHGKPIALLSPAPVEEPKGVAETIKEFKAFSRRQKRSLKGMSAKELIEEGRRL